MNGLFVYRFLSPMPRTVSEATLRRHVITEAHPEVLVSPRVQVFRPEVRSAGAFGSHPAAARP